MINADLTFPLIPNTNIIFTASELSFFINVFQLEINITLLCAYDLHYVCFQLQLNGGRVMF